MNFPVMNVPLWVAMPVIALVVLAARADVQTRKIPNAIVGPALLLGLATHFAIGGFTGLQSAFTGMLIAGAILMPGWLLRWMGAGDVKLMAAVGAWLAWPHAAIAVLASLAAGGVLALGYAIRHRVLWPTLLGAAWLREGQKSVPSGVGFLEQPQAGGNVDGGNAPAQASQVRCDAGSRGSRTGAPSFRDDSRMASDSS